MNETKYTAEAKTAGLKIARSHYTPVDGMHVLSNQGGYIVRVGDRFVTLKDGLITLVHPAAECRGGVISPECRWSDYPHDLAHRIAKHAKTHLIGFQGVVVEEALTACGNALDTLTNGDQINERSVISAIRYAAKRSMATLTAEQLRNEWARRSGITVEPDAWNGAVARLVCDGAILAHAGCKDHAAPTYTLTLPTTRS